jgi:hypothetical protein
MNLKCRRGIIVCVHFKYTCVVPSLLAERRFAEIQYRWKGYETEKFSFCLTERGSGELKIFLLRQLIVWLDRRFGKLSALAVTRKCGYWSWFGWLVTLSRGEHLNKSLSLPNRRPSRGLKFWISRPKSVSSRIAQLTERAPSSPKVSRAVRNCPAVWACATVMGVLPTKSRAEAILSEPRSAVRIVQYLNAQPCSWRRR